MRTVHGLRFAKVLAAAEQIVNFDSDREFPPGPVAAAVTWEQEWQWLSKVGGDFAERHLFRACFPNEADSPLSKIAQPPVQQPAGAAAGAGCEIALLVKYNCQPTQCCLPCNARSDDAAADNQYVTWSIARRGSESGEGAVAAVRHVVWLAYDYPAMLDLNSHFLLGMIFQRGYRKQDHMNILSYRFALALCGFVLPELASAQFFNDYAESPHRYWDAELQDSMSQWLQGVEEGKVTVPENEQTGRGLVERLLRDLKIPVESQVMVFSKTSLQRKPVTPDNPRAIYFNDDVYVGWMPGGRVEVSSFDPNIGSIYYYERDFDDGPERPLFHRERRCIGCHAGSATNFIPGPMGMSVFANETGRPMKTVMSFELSGHDVDFLDRWGGWYVTGNQGALRHMGNAQLEEVNGDPTIDREKHVNLKSLEAFFPEDKYPTKGSDLLALLLLDHQITMHNRLTEAHYRVRQAIYDRTETEEGKEPRSDYDSELETATELVVRYLLFADEVSLGAEEVAGESTFRETFLAGRKPALDGRSLRDLRLKDHIFQHRCSYMIYSPAFAGLPAPLKVSIFERMKRVLNPAEQVEGYTHLAADEKAAITSILTDTVPEFGTPGNAGR